MLYESKNMSSWQILRLLSLLCMIVLINGSCENCDVCYGTSCYRCDPGYFLNDGACTLCQANCADCFDATRCSMCGSGHFLLSDGTCSSCLMNCKLCSDSTKCQDCDTGYFLTDGTCTQCQINCEYCYNISSCQQCDEGYWLASNGSCPACRPVCYSCRSENECIICSDGYFQKDGQCLNCPSNCTECSSLSQCTACVEGLWGTTCTESCPFDCKTNICNILGQCPECKDGKWGDYCANNCSVNCFGNKCNIGGPCTDGCQAGFYGSHCESSCPNNCKTNDCDNNGMCMSGCKDGYYGHDCEHPCPTCLNNECFQNNGTCVTTCPDRCLTCSTVSTCTSCVSGYFGTVCEYECLPAKYSIGNTQDKKTCQCDEHRCSNKTNDSCTSCNDSSWFPSGPGCCPCGPGNYIDQNTCIPCSEHCTSPEQCNVSTGNCLDGCEDGWWGDKCDRECGDACNGCDRDGTCHSCSAGFYGDFCEQNCSPNCVETGNELFCNIITGNCSACKNGYYGERSESTCSEGCGLDYNGHRSCRKQDGACNAECLDGYAGSNCIKPLETKDDGIDSNILIVAAGGGGGLLLLIIVIIVAVCVVRTRNATKTENYGQNGSSWKREETAQNYMNQSQPVQYEELQAVRDDQLYQALAVEYENLKVQPTRKLWATGKLDAP